MCIKKERACDESLHRYWPCTAVPMHYIYNTYMCIIGTMYKYFNICGDDDDTAFSTSMVR